uniref:Lipoprotein n=1 Tax=Streptomyces sp. NBC_01393 TaxID=2903851 RepID=A0AAU3ICW4_9ACTN
MAATLLVTACAAEPSRPAGTMPSAPVVPARLGDTLPDDPVRTVLPATGTEARWAQGLDVFGQQVGRATTVECARQEGIALPRQPPVGFIRYFALPDLDFIERHGLSESAAVPAVTAAPDPAARTGDKAAIRRCQDQGADAMSTLRAIYVPLQRAWFGEIDAVRRDAKVVRAQEELPGCLTRHGFPVRDEQAFMALGDTRMQSASATELPYIEGEMGRAYATCMRPVEAVREPVRLRLRTRFLTEHAAEIRELRDKLVPVISEAEQRHGLRLIFPVP